jgi:hypothetical protein
MEMLTCACGARFDVDDSLAGQEVLCPECQQPLTTPSREQAPRVTSGWALASVVLALVGAFTVLGTVAAVLVGFIALLSISRNRERVTGTGFAIFGICLGILFTGLTLFALSAADVFGLETWLRERTMTHKVDTSGPLEIVQAATGFAITRPTEKWGQVQNNQSDDPLVVDVQRNLDLLLMQVARHAFIDVQTLPGGNFHTLDQCENEILNDFQGAKRPMGNLGEDEDDVWRNMHARLQSSRRLETKDGMEGREMIVEARRAGQTWLFHIRLYRRDKGRIFVVRAYAPRRRLTQIESELENALDSFRILRR